MTQSIQNFNRGQIVDLDPFTPGIQSQPPVITTIPIPTPIVTSGPGLYTNLNSLPLHQRVTFVGDSSTFRVESDRWWKQYPSWLWVLLCLVLTAIIVGGMHLLFKPKKRHEVDIDDE